MGFDLTHFALICDHCHVRDADEKSMGFLDVPGYNYSPNRYDQDHKTYPERVMVGTESFPRSSFEMWGAWNAFPSAARNANEGSVSALSCVLPSHFVPHISLCAKNDAADHIWNSSWVVGDFIWTSIDCACTY